ncbi:serine hydrolase [Agrococcus sp. SL85]|uniref:serine hydrolase domain-containing protein n=1 Tax=Agrococcus sp. SL85 TaxID=2995141 RepID=UPI00226C7F41|nr:serine hydrolase domain-containing protein [Agrococcus sp. SL85]WAC67298.1 serine hydrolase [Agrococcus sp. SL85]
MQGIADEAVRAHGVPGVVAAIARPVDEDVGVAGARTIGGPPMERGTVMRIASVTKPIVAVATLALVDRGALRLDDPVERWLPELAAPRVLRDPSGPLDDTVPAEHPIEVGHLLALRGGLGFTTDFDAPLAHALAGLGQGPPDPACARPLDEWLAAIAQVPLAHQPGAGWTYNTGLDLAGALLARLGGCLGAVLDETVLGPLGMRETGFRLRPEQVARTATSYRFEGDAPVVVDPPDGGWAGEVAFESGASGLVSTLDDLLALGRMLVDGGRSGSGEQVLSAESLALLLRPGAPSDPADPFLDGQSWSLGGSVDVVEREPWHALGRYGWMGGTGTALYAYPRSRQVAVWLTQRQLAAPDDAERLVPLLARAAERDRAA